MGTAGEGGAWGIALLASYSKRKNETESLGEFLESQVFAGDTGTEELPKKEDVEGFEVFIKRYKRGIAIEQAAIDHLI